MTKIKEKPSNDPLSPQRFIKKNKKIQNKSIDYVYDMYLINQKQQKGSFVSRAKFLK